MRRVLFIAKDWALDGGERQLCYLATGLDRERYEPLVIVDREGPLTAQLRDCGVETHVMPLHGWRLTGYMLLRYVDATRVARFGRRHKVALVHSSDMWKGMYGMYVASRLGIPSVVHVRGPVTRRDVAKHKFSRASAVIAIAQRYIDDLVAGGIAADRVHVVDDAVDLQRFHPGVAASESLRKEFALQERHAVGLVGRIEPFKRVLEFVEVVAAMGSEDRTKYFLIGEPGPPAYMQAVQQAIVRLGLENRIAILGRRDDMPAVMASLDVLVTMSGGSVMFEAMACGKVVLSIRTDGKHSVHTRHGQTACCVTTTGPEPAAAALREILADQAMRERIGRAGRQWVEEKLSPALMAKRTEAIYERLLAS